VFLGAAELVEEGAIGPQYILAKPLVGTAAVQNGPHEEFAEGRFVDEAPVHDGVSAQHPHARLVAIVEDFQEGGGLIEIMEFGYEFGGGQARVDLEVALLVLVEGEGAEGQ
jgi:hypothetical protein